MTLFCLNQSVLYVYKQTVYLEDNTFQVSFHLLQFVAQKIYMYVGKSADNVTSLQYIPTCKSLVVKISYLTSGSKCTFSSKSEKIPPKIKPRE